MWAPEEQEQPVQEASSSQPVTMRCEKKAKKTKKKKQGASKHCFHGRTRPKPLKTDSDSDSDSSPEDLSTRILKATLMTVIFSAWMRCFHWKALNQLDMLMCQVPKMVGKIDFNGWLVWKESMTRLSVTRVILTLVVHVSSCRLLRQTSLYYSSTTSETRRVGQHEIAIISSYHNPSLHVY